MSVTKETYRQADCDLHVCCAFVWRFPPGCSKQHYWLITL